MGKVDDINPEVMEIINNKMEEMRIEAFKAMSRSGKRQSNVGQEVSSCIHTDKCCNRKLLSCPDSPNCTN